jgi:hypothetical protein
MTATDCASVALFGCPPDRYTSVHYLSAIPRSNRPAAPVTVANFAAGFTMPTVIREGGRFSFWYPSHNLHGIPLEWVQRSITITGCYDMAAEPIDGSDILFRPFVRRGSILITGFDHDLRAERQFYLEAIRGMVLPSHQLATVADDGTFEPFGPIFEPTMEDHRDLLETVAEFSRTECRRQLVCIPLTGVVA